MRSFLLPSIVLGCLWSCDQERPAPLPDPADFAGTYWTALGLNYGILLELRSGGCAVTGFESCEHGSWREEGVWWQDGWVIVVQVGDETRRLRLTRAGGNDDYSLVPRFDGPWFRGETRGLGVGGRDTLFWSR